jgi:hypothetical protein
MIILEGLARFALETRWEDLPPPSHEMKLILMDCIGCVPYYRPSIRERVHSFILRLECTEATIYGTGDRVSHDCRAD